jgi:hypothetical protein
MRIFHRFDLGTRFTLLMALAFLAGSTGGIRRAA